MLPLTFILSPQVFTRGEEVFGDEKSFYRFGSEELRGWQFYYILPVCDQARESCPFLPGARDYLYKGFDDSSQYGRRRYATEIPRGETQN